MSKQRIAHGATIDAATPDEVATIVAKSIASQAAESYRREKGSIALDATGVGTQTLALSRLYDWVIERVTATAGAAAVMQFFENSPQPSDLLESITLDGNGRYSDAFSNRLFVPAGSQLIVAVQNGGANGQATFNLQVRLIKATP